MSEIFPNVFNMSVSASYIIFAVLLLRLFLKRAPKAVNVFLWALVALRLVMPFSIESALSLVPTSEVVEKSALTDEFVLSEISASVSQPGEYASNSVSDFSGAVQAENALDFNMLFSNVFPKIWLIGMAVMFIFAAVSFVRVKRSVKTAVRLCDNIYQSENVGSPFVFGIICPKIYLPFNVSEGDRENIISHEKAHIARRDHILKISAYIISAVHWFNPLVRLSYVLFCRDVELACDEKVIKNMSERKRVDYSQTLLNFSVKPKTASACPLAFGEVGVKKRMKSILNYKKPVAWIAVAAVALGAVAAVCFLTNPASNTLENIEFLKLTNDAKGVVLNEADSSYNKGAVSEELLDELLSIKISSKEASKDRSEERDKSHTIVLQNENNTDSGLKIHFNGAFTRVWVDNGVKPTLTYRVISPKNAKEIYDKIKNYQAPAEFEVPLNKKVTVLVWQMAEKSYTCYLVPTDSEEAKQNTVSYTGGVTVDQMKDFLSRNDIPRENVTVRATTNAFSSYYPRLDDSSMEKIFWN